jgi:hypothetical protein
VKEIALLSFDKDLYCFSINPAKRENFFCIAVGAAVSFVTSNDNVLVSGSGIS